MASSHPHKPIYFVHREPIVWQHIAGLAYPPRPHEADPPIPVHRGVNCWIVQTYIHLKRCGRPVQLVPGIVPGRINVLHFDHLALRARPWLGFVVAVQADRARPYLCDARIVQNKRCIMTPTQDHWLPLWSQPGLQRRNPARGDRWQRIAYFGLRSYLAPPFQTDEFGAALHRLGVEFVIRDDPATWADYRDVDAVLAVRHIAPYDLSIKPPTKLINAWLAGCIPLLGPEPAYQQLRMHSLDYLEVSTPADVLAAVDRLRADPAWARALRSAGAARASEFTDASLAKLWWSALLDKIVPAYDHWRSFGALAAQTAGLVKLPLRYMQHHRSKAYFRRHI